MRRDPVVLTPSPDDGAGSVDASAPTRHVSWVGTIERASTMAPSATATVPAVGSLAEPVSVPE